MSGGRILIAAQADLLGGEVSRSHEGGWGGDGLPLLVEAGEQGPPENRPLMNKNRQILVGSAATMCARRLDRRFFARQPDVYFACAAPAIERVLRLHPHVSRFRREKSFRRQPGANPAGGTPCLAPVKAPTFMGPNSSDWLV